MRHAAAFVFCARLSNCVTSRYDMLVLNVSQLVYLVRHGKLGALFKPYQGQCVALSKKWREKEGE